jgi:hypothetical protein
MVSIPSLRELKQMDNLEALNYLDGNLEVIKNRIKLSKNGNKKYLIRYLYDFLVVQDEFLNLRDKEV